MSLKVKIQEDLLEAVKKKEEIEALVLRQVLAAILNKEKEKRYKITRQNFPSENLSGQGKEKPNISEMSEERLIKESQLTDKEVIDVISSEVKKRKEAILEFGKGKREDLVEKEKKELEILEKYLPEQLSEEEIKKLVKEAIAAYKASLAPEEREKIGMKDIGKVMAEIMPKLKGKVEGSLVSKIVKEMLAP